MNNKMIFNIQLQGLHIGISITPFTFTRPLFNLDRPLFTLTRPLSTFTHPLSKPFAPSRLVVFYLDNKSFSTNNCHLTNEENNDEVVNKDSLDLEVKSKNRKINMNGGLYHDNKFLGKLGPKIKVYFDAAELKFNYPLDLFTKRILQSIKLDTNYLLLIKIRYQSHQYLTLGHQSRFYITDYESVTIFEDLLNFINSKVDWFAAEYNFVVTDVQEIELSFREVLFLSDAPKKISNEYRNFINNTTFTEISKSSAIFNPSIKEVVRDVDLTIKNGEIKKIDLDLIDEPIDFVKNVNDQNKFLKPENRVNLNENLEGSSFGQKIISNRVIIIKTEKISDTQIKKIAFNKDGRLLSSVTDTILDDGTIKRTWSGNSIILKGDKIIFRSKLYKFNPIKLELFNKNKNTTALPNVKIGTFDMEVFIHRQNSIVYALGFYSYLDDKPRMFYIDKDLDSRKNIFSCLNEMFKPKYQGITWYCHNSGRYDARILLNVLYSYNESINNINNIIIKYTSEVRNYNKSIVDYNAIVGKFNQKFNSNFKLLEVVDEKVINTLPLLDIKTRFRKSTILDLQITKKVGTIKYSISIRDSYAIFTSSLKTLSNKYGVTTQKGDFPHTFANDKTIFYIGNTPDISYYDGLTKNEYNSLYSDNWNFKNESLKYLSKDLISLYEVLDISNKSLHLNFNVQMVNCLTVSRLASDIFLKKFVDNNSSNLPYVNNMTIFNDIHQAYYGGITEVYRPIGYNLFYYDVNSLYPYASYNSMPGLNTEYIDYFDKTIPLDDLFGFFYCKIKTYNSGYLGLLPYRTRDRVVYPLGEWEGWYFSEELKFARDNGYSIEVVKGYVFNKVDGIFNKYVDTLSEMKANSTDSTLKNISKMLLNSLIGKYGMHPLQPITKVLDKSKVGNILLTRKVTQEVDITTNDTLISYLPGPDKDVLNEFDVDINKALNTPVFNGVDKHTYIKNISIPVAAAVTSYARIYMSKVKLDILKSNGKIYYSDTDSIITDIKLDENIVDPKKIGKFKLEYLIDKAIIPAPKVYCMETVDSKSKVKTIIKKVKGGSSDNLTVQDYENMVKGVPMQIVKKTSKTDWTDGTILISKGNITLSPYNYISRRKIMDNNNNWIDTLPININDKDIRNKLGIEKKSNLDKRNKIFYKGNRVDVSTNTVNENFEIISLNLILYTKRSIIPYIMSGLVMGGALNILIFGFIMINLLPILYIPRPLHLIIHIYYITPSAYTLDRQQFISNVLSGLIYYIIYITPRGIGLNNQQFICKVSSGLTNYIIYINPYGIALLNHQIHSYIHRFYYLCYPHYTKWLSSNPTLTKFCQTNY